MLVGQLFLPMSAHVNRWAKVEGMLSYWYIDVRSTLPTLIIDTNHISMFMSHINWTNRIHGYHMHMEHAGIANVTIRLNFTTWLLRHLRAKLFAPDNWSIATAVSWNMCGWCFCNMARCSKLFHIFRYFFTGTGKGHFLPKSTLQHVRTLTFTDKDVFGLFGWNLNPNDAYLYRKSDDDGYPPSFPRTVWC